ncbi:MAG: Mg/Co/Ni transporter MgtE, partial [Planctomycetota bacterium]
MGEHSWRELSDVVESAEREVLEQFLDELSPDDRTLAVSRLTDAARERLLETVDAEEAAEIIEGLPESQVTDAIGHMPADLAARIVEELPS